MRLLLSRGLLAAALGLCVPACALGQGTASHSPAHHSATSPQSTAGWKKYCHTSDGFCFRYPTTWSVLGDVFEGNGVVVAPAQTGDKLLWDEITVGLLVPPARDNEGTLSLDGAIEQVMLNLRQDSANPETLERQQRTIHGQPAQVLKIGYQDRESSHAWVEQMAFIEGPESEIYSIALKCSPANFTRLETTWERILASWSLPGPAAD